MLTLFAAFLNNTFLSSGMEDPSLNLRNVFAPMGISLIAALTGFFCLLHCKNDLFPEESIWHWKNGMPLLSALRSLAIGTLLGPHKERQVDWYLECGHLEKLFNQLTPHLDRIAQIIQHYAISVCALSLACYFGFLII